MSSVRGGVTTHHQRDTTFTKIFVGGLPYHTSDQTLRSYFEPFGDINEAVVITDRQTGKSRGYGFVSHFLYKTVYFTSAEFLTINCSDFVITCIFCIFGVSFPPLFLPLVFTFMFQFGLQ